MDYPISDLGITMKLRKKAVFRYLTSASISSL